MKIFVIKGNTKGIVKLDKSLHLVGENFDNVRRIIMYDNKNVKIVDVNELSMMTFDFDCKSILLLNEDDNLLGIGSIAGKADVNKILIEYNKYKICNDITNFKEKNSKNSTKIDTKMCEIDKTNTSNEVVETANSEEDKACKIIQSEKITNLDIGKMQEEKIIVDAGIEESINKEESNDSKCANLHNTNNLNNSETLYSTINLKSKTQSQNFDEDKICEIMQKDDLQVYGNNLPNDNGCLQEVYEKNNVTEQEEKLEINNEVFLKKEEKIDVGLEFIAKNFEDKCVQNNNFYADIKENLEKFLSQHPKNEELESKVWGSKWVKIKADYDYSVGIIFDENKPSIIAYAIPYEDFNLIDKDKLMFCEWLPIEEKTAKNRGYLIYYQNAETGEMLLG